jgi:hypothetical protein
LRASWTRAHTGVLLCACTHSHTDTLTHTHTHSHTHTHNNHTTITPRTHARARRTDSPNSLVTRGKRDAARKSLRRLRGVDDVDAELEDLVRAAASAGGVDGQPRKRGFLPAGGKV